MRDQFPEGWTITPLANLITSLESGSRPRGGVRDIKEGIPSIGGEHLRHDGTFDFSSVRYVPAKFAAAMARGHIQINDILVVKDGATTGKTAFVDSGFPFTDAVVNEHVFICRPVSEIEPKFLFRFLSSNEGQARILENFKGSAQGGISQSFASNAEVPVAPLAEQRRIVAKLEALLSKVDSSRKRLERVPALLKAFRQSVLAAASSGRLTADWREGDLNAENASQLVAELECTHKAAGGHKRGNAAPPTDEAHDLRIDDLPPTWRITEMRTAVRPDRPITYGILKPGPNILGGVPYVRVADFPNDRLNLATIRRTSEEIEKAYARARLREGDILLSIRGTVGRVCMVPHELQDASITQDTARLSIQPPLNASFVMWFLRAPTTQIRMQRALKGVAVRGINIGDVRALQVPVPPPAEQREIVRRIEALFGLADHVEARYARAKAQVDKLAQSLLAKAFRGELVPTEAELAHRERRDYEDAQALLSRIQRMNDGARPQITTKRRSQRDQGRLRALRTK